MKRSWATTTWAESRVSFMSTIISLRIRDNMSQPQSPQVLGCNFNGRKEIGGRANDGSSAWVRVSEYGVGPGEMLDTGYY
ncbi:hypothetical protein V6N13_114782 [Hibiscus sabdariffa]|uniref:Uncharacterized protein n=1 Tax=Hibiscus sabdariffa TaxID=183260 RepID=A0ABR2U2U1_9ROSI